MPLSDIVGKSYALTVVTPLWWSWINRFLFGLYRSLPAQFFPLVNLEMIHFARWVILPKDRWPGRPDNFETRYSYLLFASNFNGTWDVYLDEFSDVISLGMDTMWYRSIGFPKSIPSSPFKSYIDDNSIESSYYYNALPGFSLRDVASALKVRKAIHYLEEQMLHINQDQATSAETKNDLFFQQFESVMTNLVNHLPSTGKPPPHSPDSSD
ncbi:hypothetical protein [Synechococcus sp. KORDI-52]|uniref:hypothetical protein n=1 Tax=Synechococcus sp. KORDI-52 TaxID=585425 RepID=UPI0012EB5F8F|nr:hypothetical protein [Synechococcus sp. KORDI-52]